MIGRSKLSNFILISKQLIGKERNISFYINIHWEILCSPNFNEMKLIINIDK